MARRPDFGRHEDAMSSEDIKALNESLPHLSQPAVMDFQQSAYRDCRIVKSRTFPSARSA